MSHLSIIMYHYVRNLTKSRYPEIKGLLLDQFREQLAYLAKHYYFATFNECMAAVKGETTLPMNAVILSFDDGYMDHYQNVFPILDELGIQGWFFPPVKAIMKQEVLDVNKIHFVLATTDVNKIITDVNEYLAKHSAEYNLLSMDYYLKKYAIRSRFDFPEVCYIKSMLQFVLPLPVRHELIHKLFCNYVTSDEAAFSNELYMSVDQLKCLVRHGMYVGVHGYDHIWLDNVEKSIQEQEVQSGLDFLSTLGASTESWVMCYPYGAYNDDLIAVLKKKNCLFGLTTQVGIATLNKENAFLLPRLDTNDIPKESSAVPCEWTKKVLR